MKKLFLFILLLVIITGSWIAYSLYNKPHRNPDEESAIKINAIELYQEFEKNETEANKKYLDKVLDINGVVVEIASNQASAQIILLGTEDPFFGIRCTMNDTLSKAQVGDTVTLRGICTGYLSDVIIVNGKLSLEKE